MQLTQIPLSVILICFLGGSAAALANMIYFIMIGKVNERVPAVERISYLWWGSGIHAKFKRLYPESRLTWLLAACYLLLLVCFILGVRLWVFR